jgi:hypothetical protein
VAPATCDAGLSCTDLTLTCVPGLAGVTGTMVLTAGVPTSIAFDFTNLALTLALDGDSLTCESSGGGGGCFGAEAETGACGVSSITDSSLCTFDTDSAVDGSQFRLIFTQDPTSPSTFKLTASNPGQFYYNVFYFGVGNTGVKITLPYPFVTQGATPVHVYDGVTPSTSGGKTCFAPGMEIANAKTLVALSDYGPSPVFGTAKKEITVDVPALSGGFAYINIHLDYGLKGTPGYMRNTNDAPPILYGQSYEFMDDAGGMATTQSENDFKKNPGVAGLVLKNGSADPVPNVTAKIYDSTNKLLGTVSTDNDGFYMWAYKYTGKAATFVVKLPSYNLSQSLTLKSNGFVVANFTVP